MREAASAEAAEWQAESDLERANEEREHREAMEDDGGEFVRPRRVARRQREGRGGIGLVGVAAVAVIFLMGGWAAADVLTSSGITQQGAAWSVSTGGDPNLPSQPTVSLAEEPTGTTGCTVAPDVYLPDQGAGFHDYFLLGLNGTCLAGDPVEQFAFATPATLTAETLTFYASVEESGSVTLAGSVPIEVSGGPMGGAGVLYLDLDLGAGPFPTIETISLVAN